MAAKKKKKESLTLGRALRAAKTVADVNVVVAKMLPEECHAMRQNIEKALGRVTAGA